MKRALILHGMEGHGHAHWFPWLKQELEVRGFEVWVPDLPAAETPHATRWTHFLLDRRDWSFNDCLVIGHSAGAVEILQLAQALPEGQKLAAAVLCSAFTQALPKTNSGEFGVLRHMFEPQLDFAVIKAHCAQFTFVHAKDDPWCPWQQAETLANQTAGELVLLPTGRHFSTSLDPEFKIFPQLLQILNDRHLI